MKQKGKFQKSLSGLTGSITRFPLTAAFLLAETVVVALSIQEQEMIFNKLIVTFLVGVLLSMMSQTAYERFFLNKEKMRLLLSGLSVLLDGVYYLTVSLVSELDMEFNLRTIVILFALFIAFLWIPSVKSDISFNESFMAAFKAFFTAVFFSGVLFLGVVLIIGAFDMLILSVNGKIYQHSANLIFILFAPLYFLSLIPEYSAQRWINPVQKALPVETLQQNSELEPELLEKADYLQKATGVTKFLETLISYVIIPITALFTVILLLYIIMNITGSFWTDNLLEPLLVSYSIVVIIVYLLASRLDNTFARVFRKIFPKVLVPVVLFQTVSSILKIGDVGITYGRYFVILFGLFAAAAGTLFCFLPVRKNGIIAPILLILSLISILPPVDAFTVSRLNQTGRLENALKKNNMLEETTITPNASVSKEDRQIIITSVRYLDEMNYTRDIAWLSAYRENQDFQKIFGFGEYDQVNKVYGNSYFYRNQEPIPVTGYDVMLRSSLYQQGSDMQIGSFMKNGITYNLHKDNYDIVLTDDKNKEILRYPTQEIFDHFDGKDVTNSTITTEEATFTKENDKASIQMVMESVSITQYEGGKDKSAEFYLFVKIK